MEFIDRIKEQKRLHRAIDAGDFEVASAVSGRQPYIIS